MTLLIIVGIVYLIIWWEVKRAPIGYEDKNGFHEGKDPEHEN